MRKKLASDHDSGFYPKPDLAEVVDREIDRGYTFQMRLAERISSIKLKSRDERDPKALALLQAKQTELDDLLTLLLYYQGYSDKEAIRSNIEGTRATLCQLIAEEDFVGRHEYVVHEYIKEAENVA